MEENQVNEEIKEEKKDDYNAGKVVLGYLIPLVGLILVYNSKGESEKARKNYKQAGALFIVMLLWNIVFAIMTSFIYVPGIVSMAVSGLLWVGCILGAVKGYKGEDVDLPIITDVAEKMFK